MSKVQWVDLLGWTKEELNDLRFVGYSYIRQGQYEIAKKFFEGLCVLNPESAYDLQTLAAIHLELGDNLKALNYIDKSLAVDPNHAPTLLNKAKALILLGYQKQGLLQAAELKKNKDLKVASQAEALILAYEGL
jgi:tetratricopeptide (TPR) repeat protein